MRYLLQGAITFYFVTVTGNPNMVMALAGNKADLEDKRSVTSEVSSNFLSLILLVGMEFLLY